MCKLMIIESDAINVNDKVKQKISNELNIVS